MTQVIRDLVRSLSMRQTAGLLIGALIVPALLAAFADYSLLEFIGTYAATVPVALALLWLTGQTIRRQ